MHTSKINYIYRNNSNVFQHDNDPSKLNYDQIRHFKLNKANFDPTKLCKLAITKDDNFIKSENSPSPYKRYAAITR